MGPGCTRGLDPARCYAQLNTHLKLAGVSFCRTTRFAWLAQTDSIGGVQTHRCFVVERLRSRLAQTVQLVCSVMQPVKAVRPKRSTASAASWTWLVAETAGFASISVVSVRLRAACEVPE